jgi:hypothetical protein
MRLVRLTITANGETESFPLGIETADPDIAAASETEAVNKVRHFIQEGIGFIVEYGVYEDITVDGSDEQRWMHDFDLLSKAVAFASGDQDAEPLSV